MTGKELQKIRANLRWTQKRLADAIGIAVNSIACQERGEIGISEPVARIVRLIAAGVDVETIAHPDSSRHIIARKSTKGSKPGNSQGQGRRRPR